MVGFLILLHLLEVGIWALFYYFRGVLPDLETSTYFSLLTYTTVGYGDVVLPKTWRIMGTSEALVGILMTAWSTALLISVVHTFHEKTLEILNRMDQKRNPSSP
jgi:voltage-gated potassium channel Kch